MKAVVVSIRYKPQPVVVKFTEPVLSSDFTAISSSALVLLKRPEPGKQLCMCRQKRQQLQQVGTSVVPSTGAGKAALKQHKLSTPLDAGSNSWQNVGETTAAKAAGSMLIVQFSCAVE
jgi:hypothetical protein